MYIIPNNAFVRNPRTKRMVPLEGANVEAADLFWAHRRLAHGDVREGDSSAVAAAVKSDKA